MFEQRQQCQNIHQANRKILSHFNDALFKSEPVNVGRGSDVLNFDPHFLKFSPNPYPKHNA